MAAENYSNIRGPDGTCLEADIVFHPKNGIIEENEEVFIELRNALADKNITLCNMLFTLFNGVFTVNQRRRLLEVALKTDDKHVLYWLLNVVGLSRQQVIEYSCVLSVAFGFAFFKALQSRLDLSNVELCPCRGIQRMYMDHICSIDTMFDLLASEMLPYHHTVLLALQEFVRIHFEACGFADQTPPPMIIAPGVEPGDICLANNIRIVPSTAGELENIDPALRSAVTRRILPCKCMNRQDIFRLIETTKNHSLLRWFINLMAPAGMTADDLWGYLEISVDEMTIPMLNVMEQTHMITSRAVWDNATEEDAEQLRINSPETFARLMELVQPAAVYNASNGCNNYASTFEL